MHDHGMYDACQRYYYYFYIYFYFFHYCGSVPWLNRLMPAASPFARHRAKSKSYPSCKTYPVLLVKHLVLPVKYLWDVLSSLWITYDISCPPCEITTLILWNNIFIELYHWPPACCKLYNMRHMYWPTCGILSHELSEYVCSLTIRL